MRYIPSHITDGTDSALKTLNASVAMLQQQIAVSHVCLKESSKALQTADERIRRLPPH